MARRKDHSQERETTPPPQSRTEIKTEAEGAVSTGEVDVVDAGTKVPRRSQTKARGRQNARPRKCNLTLSAEAFELLSCYALKRGDDRGVVASTLIETYCPRYRLVREGGEHADRGTVLDRQDAATA